MQNSISAPSRGNKRQALSSPPQADPELKLTQESVRQIVQDVMKIELEKMLSKVSANINDILNRELQPIRERIERMNDSMTFLNNQYEDLLKEHVTSKRNVVELQKENLSMKGTIGDLTGRLNHLEQQSRSNNIEIQCLPEKKQENLVQIVADLSKVIGCSVTEKDILHCTRVAKLNPNTNRPRSVVVQLSSPRVRDEYLAATINYNKSNPNNKINSAHLGYSGPKSPIFVSEHLSSVNKALHAAARIKAKEIGYQYVWIRSGRIFMRKDQAAEHVLVRTMDTLNKLV